MKLDSTVAIDDLVASAEGAEALATTVVRLAGLISGGQADIKQIVEVVSYDQALTADLLRRANSAADGGSTPITTVRNAVVRLGTSTLLSMAMAATLSGRMKSAIPAYGLAEGELWRRSVAASITADAIRARAGVDVPGEASTAALLHDFGKVVISRHFGPQLFEMLSRAAEREGMSILEAERAVMGVDHAEVGGLVVQRWKLPLSIVAAVSGHHSTEPGRPPMSAAVSLAHAATDDVLDDMPDDGLADGLDDGGSLSPRVVDSHAQVLADLGLSAEDYGLLVEDARVRYAAVNDTYSGGSSRLPSPRRH